jgi:hypothetical protein
MNPGFRRDDRHKNGNGEQASRVGAHPIIVMAGLVPAIHVFTAEATAWMAGTRPAAGPAMTPVGQARHGFSIVPLAPRRQPDSRGTSPRMRVVGACTSTTTALEH